jgi:hypothetical protein
MKKPKNVLSISAGDSESDPECFTISVGCIPFRFRMGPSGKSTMIGPARLIDFPGADVWKKLAKPAPGSDECPDRGNRRARRTKMKIFTIEDETNSITIHALAKKADAVPNFQRFSNEAGFAKLAADWPAARLVEVWNSLPDVTRVKKFKDRATAVSRIWKAIQSLGEATPAVEETAPAPENEPVAELPQTAPFDEPEASETAQPEAVIPEATEPNVATPVAPQVPDFAPEEAPLKTKATRAKDGPKAATNASVPREESKTRHVIAMLQREGGATLEEIMTAMGWQKHTTRAMLSAGGSLTKKHGLIVTSEKVGDQRTYSIKA